MPPTPLPDAPDPRYLALVARDARCDGHWFVGVTSTGIYCRPVCRVRTPRAGNCRFYTSAARSEAAGFRPCLKCRPELAPGPGLPWSTMDASRTLAHQAAAAFEVAIGFGHAPSVTTLAQRFGITDRHLRRIFQAEHGVSPLQYVQTRRLLLAKHLLTDTRLPVGQVALASGFRSLRRFNAAFADGYRMNPTRLRSRLPAGSAEPGRSDLDGGGVRVELAYRAPYSADALCRFVARRALAGIEVVDLPTLRICRTVPPGALGAAVPGGWIEATFVPASNRVRLHYAPSLAAYSARVVAAARRWLDLDAAPDAIDAALASLPGDAGMRLPGCIDAFEIAVRAVLGQQVTVAAARSAADRLVTRFGMPAITPFDPLDRLFPTPDLIATTAASDIAALGIIGRRALAIVALAHAWPALQSQMHSRCDPQPLIASLCALPGIGAWTAHYIAMRALGWHDAFPPGDAAVRSAVHRRFGAMTPTQIDTLALRWAPWRSYAVLRLWASLDETAP